jgi:hypothetical protein
LVLFWAISSCLMLFCAISLFGLVLLNYFALFVWYCLVVLCFVLLNFLVLCCLVQVPFNRL